MGLPQLIYPPAPCWQEGPSLALAPRQRRQEATWVASTNFRCSSSVRALFAMPREPVMQAVTARRGCLAPLRRPPSASAASHASGQGESPFDIQRLELYTSKVKSEVLLVSAEVDGEEDEILVFRGYSSSLVRPTATDPGEPVLPPTARVRSIDRIKGPFNPASIEYIQQGMTWEEFQALLSQSSL